MGSLAVPKALAFLSAAGVGAAIVVVAANVGGGQADRCFGRGAFLQEITGEGGKKLAECQPAPFQYIYVDEEGNAVGESFLYEKAGEYYEQHPELLPTPPGPESLQYLFVKPEVPPEVVAAAQEGCDPSWVVTENATARGRFCHPAGWEITFEQELVGIVLDEKPVSIGIASPNRIVTLTTSCVQPENVFTLDTAAGRAKLCATRPEYWGQQWGLTLPNGRRITLAVYNEAGPGDVATAVRVAVNVENLP